MVIGIVGCHKAPAPEVQPWPARELGEYSYRLLSATPVNGKFTILADTVTMDAQQQSCRRVGTGVINPEVHPFRCVGGSMAFNVYVNSRDPLLSTWNTAKTVKKTVEICMKYGYTTTGQKECSSSRREVRTVTVRDGGRLDITRIESADKP
jgi:hypothetical protein